MAAFGLTNVTSACVSPEVAPFSCSQPDEFLFWDGIHPDERGARHHRATRGVRAGSVSDGGRGAAVAAALFRGLVRNVHRIPQGSEDSMNSTWRVAFVLFVILTARCLPASAQTSAPGQQVVSANPFGLLLEFFNAEYERKVSTSTTAGAGGSTIHADGNRYVNADVFLRYYPRGRALQGLAVGLKAGVTEVDSERFFGVGFDVNQSWLMGNSQKFYIGWGFGLKRLVGADEFQPVHPDDSPGEHWRRVLKE